MKKRQISRFHPNDQRPPSNRVPNPQFHFPKSPLTKEIGRQKKVKFTDSGKESPRTSCRLERDYSHMQPERENVTTCDAKTSEYAFFKKLKKDANLRFPSGSLKKDVTLSTKKPESGDCSKERTNNAGIGKKGYNSSSRIIHDVSTFKTDSFRSPSLGAWNVSDLHSISSSMPRNSHSCGGTLKPQYSFSHEGNRYVHGEIFSRKRQKLRQCVADAVFPDMENLCSKGHDIVSMLLNRLLPMGTVKNKYKDSNPVKVESATGYDLLDSRDSKVQFKEQYQIPKRKLLELESDSYFNDQLLPPPMFLRSYERATQHAKFPTYDRHSFQPPYSITAPECKLSGTPSFSAFVKGDVSLEPLSNQISNATRYSLHDSRELDVHFTEHHQIPKRKLLELESNSYFSDHLLSPMDLKPVELITSHADFPIYPLEFQPVFRTEAESKFDGIPSFVDKNDVTHGFLCNEQKHETFASNHFVELGKLEREPIPLLEKDFDCIKDGEFSTYHSHKFQPPYSITAPKCKLSETPSFSASVTGDETLESLSNNVANATGYNLHDSRELDVHFTEHHQIPRRKLLELESSSHFSDHLLSPMHLKPVELITSHTDFPIYPHKFQPVFRTEAESKFDGIPSFVDKNDVTPGFLCNEQKHETFTLNHFEELGKLKREPIPLLLEKDFDCIKDEMMMLPITCKYAKPDMAASLSILGHSEEKMSNNALGEYHFSPSSLLLDKPQDFNSELDSGLLRYQEFRFGKYVYKDYEDSDMNFNHKALSLSNNMHFFKLSDNCKIDTSFVKDSMYLSPFRDWFSKVVSSDYDRHPHTDAWLPSSLDECQRRLISSPSDSRTLQLPQRESMSSLFHIDNSYEPEIDGGNPGEVIYHFSKDFMEINNSSLLHMSMQKDNGWPFSLNDSDNITEGEQSHEMLL